MPAQLRRLLDALGSEERRGVGTGDPLTAEETLQAKRTYGDDSDYEE